MSWLECTFHIVKYMLYYFLFAFIGLKHLGNIVILLHWHCVWLIGFDFGDSTAHREMHICGWFWATMHINWCTISVVIPRCCCCCFYFFFLFSFILISLEILCSHLLLTLDFTRSLCVICRCYSFCVLRCFFFFLLFIIIKTKKKKRKKKNKSQNGFEKMCC